MFIGNGDNNDMDYMSDQTTPYSSSDAHVAQVDKDDKEWRMHGRPDREEAAFESGPRSLSSMSCKTNPLLMLSLVFMMLSKLYSMGQPMGLSLGLPLVRDHDLVH